MKVGNRRSTNKQNMYQLQSREPIEYAVNVIKKSPVAPFVRALYLYGSCVQAVSVIRQL